MDRTKRIRAQGNSGRCTKQMSKRRHSKKMRNENKGKEMNSKLVVLEEANLEKLIETNQLFTNVNNLLEPTFSTDKVELRLNIIHRIQIYLFTHFLYCRVYTLFIL